MPRGRHRLVSTATRISLLAAVCAPALAALVLAVVAGGSGALRLAVVLGVASAAGAIAWLVRGTTAQQRRLADERIARRRERERLMEEGAVLRAAREELEGDLRRSETELARLRAVSAAVRPARPLTPDLLARGAAVLDLLERRAGADRPAAPSIVPAVRRPPVSAPDLVRAYAASAFGPEAAPAAASRPAGPPGAGVPAPPSEATAASGIARASVATGTPAHAAAARYVAPAGPAPAAPSAPPPPAVSAAPGAAAASAASGAPAAPVVPADSGVAAGGAAAPAGSASGSGARAHEVTRMVRDQVREASRRVEGLVESAGRDEKRFDFFTRGAFALEPAVSPAPAPVPPAPVAEAETPAGAHSGVPGAEAVRTGAALGPGDDVLADTTGDFGGLPAKGDDIEADRIADPVAGPQAAPPAGGSAPAPAPAQGVRFNTEGRVPAVRQPKPLPVDLTAHDETEEMPRIEVRRRA